MLIPNNEMTRSLCAWIDKNLHSWKRDFQILLRLVQTKLVNRSFWKRVNSKSLIQRFMDDTGCTKFM